MNFRNLPVSQNATLSRREEFILLQEILHGTFSVIAFALVIFLVLRFIKRKILKTVLILTACVLTALWAFNPGRADFNQAVFEGGKPNLMAENQGVLEEIKTLNTQCYQNSEDTRIQRKNYVLFSVYDVKVSDAKTYHVLGIMQTFHLLNT